MRAHSEKRPIGIIASMGFNSKAIWSGKCGSIQEKSRPCAILATVRFNLEPIWSDTCKRSSPMCHFNSVLNSTAQTIGGFIAKPMEPRVCDSYGKTHGMAKAMGVSMAKPMGLKFSILTMVGSTMETADMSPTQNYEGFFTIFVVSIWTNLLT